MFRQPAPNSWFWRLLEKGPYRAVEPPPRTRTEPMQVLAVGLPRSGTESMQQALMLLGYDYTYHGFDVGFEEPHRLAGWVRLCRKKWYGGNNGDVAISADEFDEVVGHAVALTDVAASAFAVDLIKAYPDAKVILNMRHDLDAWHRSMENTVIQMSDDWWIHLLSWFATDMFWMHHLFSRFLMPPLFRAPDGDFVRAARRNGKWVYRDHCNLIRGTVPPERLLEWNIGDGWEPLCEFLDKPIPDVEFPHSNAANKGWKERMEWINEHRLKKAQRNLVMFIGAAAAAATAAYKLCW